MRIVPAKSMNLYLDSTTVINITEVALELYSAKLYQIYLEKPSGCTRISSMMRLDAVIDTILKAISDTMPDVNTETIKTWLTNALNTYFNE